ncbi:MAG: metallophosphoesterase, partial [Oscillospiraceae bacterium]
MIYVTGDTHGDISRFKTKQIRALKKKDFLIICGDFGFIWDGSKQEEKILKWIGKRRFTTLFVEGTHDNIEKISQYPLEEVGGEKAHKISGRLFHLRRGCIYSFDEKRVFAFGGGESDDNDSRVLGETWWAEEIPNADEVKFAIENLKLFDERVDYIITHEAPPKIELSLDK